MLIFPCPKALIAITIVVMIRECSVLMPVSSLLPVVVPTRLRDEKRTEVAVTCLLPNLKIEGLFEVNHSLQINLSRSQNVTVLAGINCLRNRY